MKDNYFKGVHETCYGDKWSALLGNSEIILDEIAPNTIQQSNALSVDKHEDASYMIQLYTETAPIRFKYRIKNRECIKSS